ADLGVAEDVVRIRRAQHGVDRHPDEAGAVDALMGEGTAVHLDGDSAGDRRVFGPAAGLVRSQALVRLSASPGAPPGLLALGSRDGARFQPGQGTELLGFLARLLERLLQAWLDLPA
ncbi:MAG: DUF484 family protein, partial [Alphaproteobacteria bacterium]|nr:DUF484 family protein [Alphaproteobacteria bacterium]